MTGCKWSFNLSESVTYSTPLKIAPDILLSLLKTLTLKKIFLHGHSNKETPFRAGILKN